MQGKCPNSCTIAQIQGGEDFYDLLIKHPSWPQDADFLPSPHLGSYVEKFFENFLVLPLQLVSLLSLWKHLEASCYLPVDSSVRDFPGMRAAFVIAPIVPALSCF